MRVVIDSPRPKPVRTTDAPCSCASLATAKAIDASVSTPVISRRLPSTIPGTVAHPVSNAAVPSVAHAESAVNWDDSAGDVGGGVTGQPGDDAGHLVRAGVATERDLREQLVTTFGGQCRRHVVLDDAGTHAVRRDAPAAEPARDRSSDPNQAGFRRGVVALPRGPRQPNHTEYKPHPPPPHPQHAFRRALGEP